jgi:hypothetical protein
MLITDPWLEGQIGTALMHRPEFRCSFEAADAQ